MSDALKATGRPILFSMCEWGTAKTVAVGQGTSGNSWRTTGDIADCWDCKKQYEHGFLTNLDLQVGLESFRPAPATGTIPTCSKSATAE